MFWFTDSSLQGRGLNSEFRSEGCHTGWRGGGMSDLISSHVALHIWEPFCQMTHTFRAQRSVWEQNSEGRPTAFPAANHLPLQGILPPSSMNESTNDSSSEEAKCVQSTDLLRGGSERPGRPVASQLKCDFSRRRHRALSSQSCVNGANPMR